MASYYVYSGATGSGNGSSWANAYTTLSLAFSGKTAGDIFYVAHDHVQSSASSFTLTSPGTITAPVTVICVNRAGSVPPVSADRRTTAQVATTGGTQLRFAGYTHYDGVIFTAADGAFNGLLMIPEGGASVLTRFDNCSLRLGGTGSGGRIYLGAQGAATGTATELNNTTVSFAAVGQSIDVASTLKWRNTPSAVIGTVPTILFNFSASNGGTVDCIGVDLSALGSGKTIAAAAISARCVLNFLDCKLDAAVTKSGVPTTYGGTETNFTRSGSAGVNYTVYCQRVAGSLVEETIIVRTGGASDGTTPIAWKVVTTANCTYSMPFECPPIAIWNDTTGSAKTATVEGIWGGGAVPLDNEIWVELEYLSSATSPQGSFVNDGTADLLTTAANQTSSSATWGGSTTKFKLAVTFTPQQKGLVYARVKCGKASSTFYIDPMITLT
jgi:hypothetical protein